MYIESGCYRGFMHQTGKYQIASDLHVETHNLLLWQVYTDADFKVRQHQKYCKRPPPKNPVCKTFKTSLKCVDSIALNELCEIMLCRIMLFSIILCRMLFNITLCRIMLCNISLCRVTLQIYN